MLEVFLSLSMWLNLQNYFNFNKDFVAQLRTAEKYLITVVFKFKVIKSNY